MVLDFVRQPVDPKTRNEQVTPTNQNKEIKKYCLNKFKAPSPANRFNAIRRNSSVKVTTYKPSIVAYNRTKVEPATSQELPLGQKEENQSETSKLISIKRRVELIRNHQNKRKLTLKDEEAPGKSASGN